MRLSFHGADRSVTGSCHLLECGDLKVLVDCGLFQGSREEEAANAGDFGFDPAAIDIVLLTHAHLDHCGRLPLLMKRGFRGEIIATSATRELCRLVLLDAAHLQEAEAREQERRAQRRGGSSHKAEPLYSLLDALNTFDRFGRIAEYDKPLVIDERMTVAFIDAGHILGSASVLVETSENGVTRKVLFSGDLGNSGRPLLRDPLPPAGADIVVMETTYGDRLHRPLDGTIGEFYEALNDSFHRGGNVVIPTFALERAQDILFYLREGIEKNRLPPSMQVFLDSPMAISATEIFRRHRECYDQATAALFASGRDPFALPGLTLVRDTADSVALNRIHGGAVIMAGSGMCTGGRVRHHLRHNLWRPDSSVIFVGFASAGTLARQIVDGAKSVTILGERVLVRARVHTINGFSAHADQAELLAWHSRAGARRTFLTHGEPKAMEAFASLLQNAQVDMPTTGQAFDL